MPTLVKQETIPELKSIHAAINWIMGQMGYVQKKKSGGLAYSFAGEVALIKAVRPFLVQAGVTMTVVGVQNKSREKYESKSGSPMTNTVLDLIIRFYHVSSDTFLDVIAAGEGADSGDKSSNKAMTCAYKYALRETFCIETGDDPAEVPSSKSERKPNAPVTTSPASTTKVVETEIQSKTRLVSELREHYKDGAAVATAMKQEPVIVFDVSKFEEIKTQLIERAKKTQPVTTEA